MNKTVANWARFSAVVALLATLGAAGCGHNASPALRSLPMAQGPRAADAVAALSAASSVQRLPAYREAQSSCLQGRYRQAALILARLEHSPSMSADQRAFCKSQEQICLGHLKPAVSFRPAARSSTHSPGSSTQLSVPADCGPRSLLLACQALGVQTTLPALTRAAGTGIRGTSFAGLKRAAQALHLKAEGVQSSREALADLPLPAIAWLPHRDHFVVVLSMQGRGENGMATIHDPNDLKAKSIPQESLLQMSGGYLLTLRR